MPFKAFHRLWKFPLVTYMPSPWIFLKFGLMRLSQKQLMVLAINICVERKLIFILSEIIFSNFILLSGIFKLRLAFVGPFLISLSPSWNFDWGWHLFQGQFKTDTSSWQLPITPSYMLVIRSADLWGFDLTSSHFWQSYKGIICSCYSMGWVWT